MTIDLSQLTPSQLDELIQRAVRRKEEIQSETVQKLRERILKLIADEGMTFEQVFGTRRPRRKTESNKLPPKYCNPANPSQTWAGRGKRPRWFIEALAAGKQEKDLMIG